VVDRRGAWRGKSPRSAHDEQPPKRYFLQTENSPTSEIDWEAVRHDYEAGQLTVDDICTARGISVCRLYDRRARDGWQLRQPSRSWTAAGNERELAARLAAALDRKMRHYEARLRRGAGNDSVADSERDARTLNLLIRLFEKLMTLQGALPRPVRARRDTAAIPADGPATTATKDTHDQERLRGELARRLETLRGQIGG
jgi:hypothetical protein